MNNVSIIGRITADIELRATPNGISAVSMFVAINNGKDQDGNERPADFPKVYVYDKQAENLAQYCHKGSLVGITGSIKTRSWDKDDGTKGYETYIRASRVQFLDAKQSNNAGIPEPDYIKNQSSVETSANSQQITTDPYEAFGQELELSEDQLPF